MAKRRKTSIGGQFAARLIEMLESPAWRVLSLSAHRVLDRVEIEHAHHGGTQNGALPVTYEDFCRYGIHRHAIRPAINEAIALGFLAITEPGRAGNREFRAPNKFRLTYRPCDRKGDQTTDEWRRFRTLEEAEAAARASRAGGPGRPVRGNGAVLHDTHARDGYPPRSR